MDQADIEGTARWLYRAARLEDDEPAHPLDLAGMLRIPVLRTSGIRTPAALARVGEEWRIYLRRRLTPRAEAWLVAHELAEWALMRERYEAQDVETVADRLAAAIRAPARAAGRVARATGIPGLAAAFDTSRASAALRLGEVTGRPVAVLGASGVRVRGEPWQWPLGALEGRGGRLPGVRKLRLDRRTVALVALNTDA